MLIDRNSTLILYIGGKRILLESFSKVKGTDEDFRAVIKTFLNSLFFGKVKTRLENLNIRSFV